MQEQTHEGSLFCKGRKWTIRIDRIWAVPEPRFDRIPSPTAPNDQAYHGAATLTADHEGELPTDIDLRASPDVVILIDWLPLHGKCGAGEWQVPVVVTEVESLAGGKSLRFEFIQNGGLGRSLV